MRKAPTPKVNVYQSIHLSRIEQARHIARCVRKAQKLYDSDPAAFDDCPLVQLKADRWFNDNTRYLKLVVVNGKVIVSGTTYVLKPGKLMFKLSEASSVTEGVQP